MPVIAHKPRLSANQNILTSRTCARHQLASVGREVKTVGRESRRSINLSQLRDKSEENTTVNPVSNYVCAFCYHLVSYKKAFGDM